MRKFALIFFLLSQMQPSFGQSPVNDANAVPFSPGAAAANSSQVNLFTGAPDISVPLYNYSNPNGLRLNIYAQFSSGGIRVNQSASIIGLGWYLNAGGMITREVRSLPDDTASIGFMYASAVPTDYRNKGDKYYNDSLDAEQDVYEYNFDGKSGKFYIGKNKQIVQVPDSKMKITFTNPGSGAITSFTFTTESGIKYVFSNSESTIQSVTSGDAYYKSVFTGTPYISAWDLSKIITPFNTDTIQFNYTRDTIVTGFSYPQQIFINNSTYFLSGTYTPTGTNTSYVNRINSIVFPDKRQINFVYSKHVADNNNQYALFKMKISDSVFRYGYAFGYQTSYTGHKITSFGDELIGDSTVYDTSTITYPTRLLLSSITPYTAKEAGLPYKFVYNSPFPVYDPVTQTALADSIANGYDYWGYFNGFNNSGNTVPAEPYYDDHGAFRMPSSVGFENSLDSLYLPTGGVVHYEYETNEKLAYTKQMDTAAFLNTLWGTYDITFTDVISSRRQLIFSYGSLASRTGSAPLSGTCNLVCNILSSDGGVLYKTDTISLYDLFYLGTISWSFNLGDGSYKMQTLLIGGGSMTASFNVNVIWENKASSTGPTYAGGIRVKKITRSEPGDVSGKASVIEEYKYTLANGNSSGFLGDIPQYEYNAQDYIILSSDPVNTVQLSGSNVGYSMVTVYKGTATHNLGKTVYEFTGLQDVNSNYSTYNFPFVPQDIKDWGLGLPKRVSVYDSSGTLVKRTTNQYSYTTLNYSDSSFTSLKLGEYDFSSTPVVYVGQKYSLVSGHVNLSSTTDTLYNSDGSQQTAYQNYTYDSTYFDNVKKITTSYDRSRGLQVETRMYYPYDYTVGGVVGKLRDSSIITPVIATEKWITGDANPRIVSGAITNYQQLTAGYIRPLTSYSLQTNAPVLQTTIGGFDASQLNRNSTYFVAQASYPTYDGKGNLLQTTNSVSGQNASVIMDYNNEYVIAKVSNAAVTDIACTSFESDGNGNWTIGSSSRNTSAALTGKLSYTLSSGNITKSGLNTSLTYIVSLWAKTGASINVNSVALSTITASQNGWSLYTKTLSGISTITISGSGTIDEVRLYPKDANMVSYTYEPLIGITSVDDANNTIAYTQYDNLNRIKLERNKDSDIIKRYDYSDSALLISIAPKLKVIQSATCESNQSGAVDSVFIDTNFYSDTYLDTIAKFTKYDYCGCYNACSIYYKYIGSVCSAGNRYNSSSVNNGNGTWTCYYYIKWSDGSTSSTYSEIHSSGCSLGLQGGPPCIGEQ